MADRRPGETHDGHRLGCRPDQPDHRDFRDTRTAVAVPTSADNSKYLGPVLDQGALGSCTSNGVAGAFEYLDNKLGRTVELVSRLFQYFNSRRLEGSTGSDAGSSIRDAIKAAAQWGEIPESLWPYDISKFTVSPTPDMYAQATHDRAITYTRCANAPFPGALTIAGGGVVVGGISVYESFMLAGTNGGWVPLPEPGETLEGGHCVLSHGYDQALTWQKIMGWITDRNSWGDGWGDKGNFRIPIAYYQNPQLASDFWEISVTG